MKPATRARLLAALPSGWFGWIGLGFLIVLGMVTAGGLLGGILYPLVGTIIGKDLTVLRMLRLGFMDGAFYALIWAPGMSIVLCIAGAYEKRRDLSSVGGYPLDTTDKNS